MTESERDMDERVKLPKNAEQVLRALLSVDPNAPQAVEDAREDSQSAPGGED